MSLYQLLLGGANRVRFDQQGRNFVHRHTFFEPCLVVAGRGEFDHGDAHHRLRPGDLFLAEPGVFHEITSLRTRDLDLVFTSFALTENRKPAGASSPEDHVVRDFVKSHVIWRGGQSRLAGQLRAFIESDALRPAPYRDYFRAEALRLIVLQMMAALTAEPAAGTARERAAPASLDRALQAIDARVHEPIWVEDVARASGVSERSLRRLFRDRLGRTVAEEIQERKVQRAATLLALPEFNVAEASRQVGIEDPAQFSRLFKKVMGVSPRQFRAQRIPVASERTLFTPIGGVAMKTEFRDARVNANQRPMRSTSSD